jgi:hypothetical protein
MLRTTVPALSAKVQVLKMKCHLASNIWSTDLGSPQFVATGNSKLDLRTI